MIGLDTTAIIDIFKGERGIKKLLEKIDEPFVSTIINYQEIMFGLNFEDLNHKKEESYYDEFFKELIIFSLDAKSSKRATEIFWKLKQKGGGRFDCMIAGIFLSNGVNKIITRNVKHFENVKGLRVVCY